MAKITALPVAEQIAGFEHIPIVQDQVTKRLSVSEFRAAIVPYLQDYYKGAPGENAGAGFFDDGIWDPNPANTIDDGVWG